MQIYKPIAQHAILQSHVQLGAYLNADIINHLIHLFDEYNHDPVHTIRAYIEKERLARGLDMSGVTIKSEVYGYSKSDSTLYVGIQKNNKDFLHLTIHLNVKTLKPKNAGMIHMFKNVYKGGPVVRKKLYTLISAHEPPNKPNSLEFFVADGYITPNVQTYDSELHSEMNIIITVLNRMFDETNPDYYVGNQSILQPIHDKTNLVLQTMNAHISHIARKNIGVHMNPSFQTGTVFPLKSCTTKHKYTLTTRTTSKQPTRKSMRNRSNRCSS